MQKHGGHLERELHKAVHGRRRSVHHRLDSHALRVHVGEPPEVPEPTPVLPKSAPRLPHPLAHGHRCAGARARCRDSVRRAKEARTRGEPARICQARVGTSRQEKRHRVVVSCSSCQMKRWTTRVQHSSRRANKNRTYLARRKRVRHSRQQREDVHRPRFCLISTSDGGSVRPARQPQQQLAAS